MGDDHSTRLRRAQHIEAFCHDAQSINVKAGVCFVKNTESRFEHGHLENLVALAFAAAKSFVDTAAHKVGVEPHELTFLFEEFKKFSGRNGLLSEIFALRINSGPHEVGHRDTRDFRRCLKRHEDALV